MGTVASTKSHMISRKRPCVSRSVVQVAWISPEISRIQRRNGRVGCFFFFQAEDGIRDLTVTGVQTCALPILNLIDVIDVYNPVVVYVESAVQIDCNDPLMDLDSCAYVEGKALVALGSEVCSQDRKSVV